MTKYIKKNKSIVAGSLFALISLSAIIPSANASILDWFGESEKDVEQTSVNSAFIDNNGLSVYYENINDSTLVSGGFILAKTSPEKNIKQVISKNKFTIVRELVVQITGYSSTKDQTDDSPFISANGSHVYEGMVAANFLPFGTKIKIPEYFGDRVFVVEDRMNKRYWQKVDVWFPDRESAIEFGRKSLKIQILES